ncbi:MAG: hypothetical protein A2137_05680 [Chloroflexi bacterium RBG_16_58_8]|nr:MAG: hypothetical protein A2137_05680 [Chloroflexi bacterium RBG_16_58_8]
MAKKKKAVKAPRELTRRQISHHRQQQRRQRIIFIGGITVIAAVILVILAGWLTGEYIPFHRTVLKVNGASFSTGYLINYLEMAGTTRPNTTLSQLAGSAYQQLAQDELMTKAAADLGITVSKKEAADAVRNANIPVTDGAVGFVRSLMLRDRLNSQYFGKLVPNSDNQVHALIMMLESDTQAQAIRGRLESGDNFTALATQYALNYYSKNTNNGDFGWHPVAIYQAQLGSAIPVDYAFSAGAGDFSQPLNDNETYKQLGYWLIRVNSRPQPESANVSALLISDVVLADGIKARLEAGESLTGIADKYTQYSPSRDKHGELGMMSQTDNISDAFNGYVFGPAAEVGKWSNPIRDENYWSQGGSWLVKVVGRENNRTITTDDRNFLINKAFEDWANRLWSNPANQVDDSYFNSDIQNFVIEQAAKGLQKPRG